MSRLRCIPLIAVLFSAAAFAHDGTLDASFGNGGLVEIPWFYGTAEANVVGIDSSGRIIVGGDAIGLLSDSDFALFRLLPNGTLDSNFASDGGGFRLVDFDLAGIGGRSDDKINDLAVLGDGSAIAIGEAHFGFAGVNSQYALAKTDPGGALDTSFGTAGTAHFGFNTFQAIDQGQFIRIDDVGRPLVTGTVAFELDNNPALVYWAGIARLTPNGQIDSSFNGNGRFDTLIWADKSTTPTTNAAYNFPSSLNLDSSQRIIVTGSIDQPFPQAVAVLRTLANGAVDTAFGAQGSGRVLLSPIVANASATWPLPDGRLMVSGTFGSSRPDTPFLMRLNEDGSVDTTFADSGLATTPALDANQYALLNFLAPTKDAGWLLAGHYGVVNGQDSQAAGVILIRFDADGNPDSSFGPNGMVSIIPDPDRLFVASRAVLQPDGKLVVAGSMPNSIADSTAHFAVVRVLADYETIFANGFESAP